MQSRNGEKEGRPEVTLSFHNEHLESLVKKLTKKSRVRPHRARFYFGKLGRIAFSNSGNRIIFNAKAQHSHFFRKTGKNPADTRKRGVLATMPSGLCKFLSASTCIFKRDACALAMWWACPWDEECRCLESGRVRVPGDTELRSLALCASRCVVSPLCDDDRLSR